MSKTSEVTAKASLFFNREVRLPTHVLLQILVCYWLQEQDKKSLVGIRSFHLDEMVVIGDLFQRIDFILVYFLRLRVMAEILLSINALASVDFPRGLADDLVYDGGPVIIISTYKPLNLP